MQKKILILEDDIYLADNLKKDFSEHQFQVEICNQIKQIPNISFDFALIDLRLASGDLGLDAIEILKKQNDQVRILILSGYASITTAVEAIKRGAIDYLTKPTSFKEILNAFEGKRLVKDSEFKSRSLSDVEHEYIDYVLNKNQGNISQTAKDLGLHRQSLQRKLKKYT